MGSTKATVGEVYATQRHDGRWCACQVVRSDGREIELLALDWSGEVLPTVDDLRGVKPLVIEHEGTRAPCRVNAGPVPPWRFELVGEMPLVAEYEHRCTVWSGWGYVPHQALMSWRWEQEVPAEMKAARRRLRERRRERVEIDLGSGPRLLDAATWRLWLGPEEHPNVPHSLRIAPDRPVPWERFGPLMHLNEVHYTGSDPGFVTFLEERPFVSRVRWRGHEQRVIDLSSTRVVTFSVEVGPGPLAIVLPKVAGELHLLDLKRDARIHVSDQRDGWGVHLHLACDELPLPIEGLSALRSLTARGLERADASNLSGYPALQSVTLEGAPGTLENASALAQLPDLKELCFRSLEIESLDELSSEQWPELDTFEARGMAPEVVEQLRELFEGVRVLTVRSSIPPRPPE